MGGTRRGLFFALALSGVVRGTASADVVVTSWLGGAGSWNVASNWSGGVVPNNASGTTFDVRIDGGQTVSSTVMLRSTPPVTIDALSIDSGDTLQMTNVASLTVTGSVLLDGMIRGPRILLGHNGIVSGNGTIDLTSGILPVAHVRAASGALTIGDGISVIGGSGDGYYGFFPGSAIGTAGAALINRGRIRAGPLLIIAGSAIDNQGSLETELNGVLGIDSEFSFASIGSLDYRSGSLMALGVFDNRGRNLQIDDAHGGFFLGSSSYAFGNTVPARVGTIRGGTVTTADGKSLVVSPGALGRLDDVTLSGSVVVYGRLEVAAGQHFRGTADIFVRADHIEDIGVLRAQSGPTVIEQGVRVHGGAGPFLDDSFGVVGNDGATLTNDGTIRADADRRFTLRGGTLLNRGALEADADGEIVALGTTVFNRGTLHLHAGGEIVVPDGDVLFESGARLVVDGGGSLTVNFIAGDFYGGLLDLSAAGDSLIVLPRAGGGPYVNHTIVNCEFARVGTFSFVTPGISVQYLPRSVVISGTPIIPEPAAFATAAASMLLLASRRRGHRSRRTPRSC